MALTSCLGQTDNKQNIQVNYMTWYRVISAMEKQGKEGDRVRAWRAAILERGHRRPPPDDTEQKGLKKAGL